MTSDRSIFPSAFASPRAKSGAEFGGSCGSAWGLTRKQSLETKRATIPGPGFINVPPQLARGLKEYRTVNRKASASLIRSGANAEVTLRLRGQCLQETT